MDFLEPVDLETLPGSHFQRGIVVLIMLTTILGALVAFLETDAGIRADRATRQSQLFAIQAMGERLRTTQHNLYDIQIFAMVNEVERLGWNAESYATALDRVPGRSAQAEQYRSNAALLAGAGVRLRALSPLLEAQATGQAVDLDRAIEASLVPARGRAEWQRAVAREAEVWDSKSGEYLAIITILAVALFLFGLSLTLDSRIRVILVLTGVLISGSGGVWAVAVFARPVPAISGEAIDAYMLGTTALDLGEIDEAIAHLDRAIALDPVLGGAWADRGYARSLLADPGARRAAIDDLTAALRLGVDNGYSRSTLGRLYVAEGAFEQAIVQFQAAIAHDPSHAAYYLALARAQLLSGSPDARATTDRGIALLAAEPAFARAATLTRALAELRALAGSDLAGDPADTSAVERMLAEAVAQAEADDPLLAIAGGEEISTAIDQALTPFQSTLLAVRLSRPAGWHLLGGEADDRFVAFASPDDEGFIILTSEGAPPYDVASTTHNQTLLDAAVLTLRQQLGPLTIGDPRPTSVAGHPALALDYTSGGEAPLRGVLLTVTTSGATSYLIRYESGATHFHMNEPHFAALLESLALLPPTGD